MIFSPDQNYFSGGPKNNEIGDTEGFLCSEMPVSSNGICLGWDPPITAAKWADITDSDDEGSAINATTI